MVFVFRGYLRRVNPNSQTRKTANYGCSPNRAHTNTKRPVQFSCEIFLTQSTEHGSFRNRPNNLNRESFKLAKTRS